VAEKTTGGVQEIRKLYYAATRLTIARDLARAVTLFKSMSEEERDRAVVYMDGLSQMRSEWTSAEPPAGRGPGPAAKTRVKR
jgi:hypothetical protein